MIKIFKNMSKKRRTKKQKLKAKERGVVSQPVQTKLNTTSLDEVQLFRYDKKLILKDLLRSFIITGFVLTLLLGVYFWLK